MINVLLPLADGFEEIEAVCIIDVLRRADINVLVASLKGETLVKGANKIVVSADLSLRDVNVDELDMIVLPGGHGGTNALANDERVQSILKEMDKKGKNIGAICAAPYALHRAGVLKHNYTCYPSTHELIREDGYNPHDMIVEDKNVMTSRGPATAICFALAIVKKLKGEETFRMLKGGLLADNC